jgi:hypothetical protein
MELYCWLSSQQLKAEMRGNGAIVGAALELCAGYLGGWFYGLGLWYWLLLQLPP